MKESKGDRAFTIFNYIFLAIVAVVVLYPLIFVLSASLSNPEYVISGDLWLWPKEFTVEAYEKVFQNPDIINGFINTLKYTFFGTLLNIVMTICAAYPLSRRNLKGKGFIMAFMVFTMFFSGGLIPTYLLIRDLGMINTFWVMIIPNAVAVWNIIIMRTFFQSIPYELEESAMIDGAGNFRILWSIVLPLSLPVMAVMVLFYAVGHWNSYFQALIYLQDQDKFPLQLILRQILIQGQADDMIQATSESFLAQKLSVEGLKYAVLIVANLPMLMLYPFLQRYFVKGVMIGSLKG
ncbi:MULTISPECIES: carbohydrate ABC transporter permease [Lysinibacillus]|uniref:Carbohydrate ABC transporter membrane protein 2, CUT1 family n=1 Tax=Lysinibacillus fusiformis TaxID=28031 RepID=A0A1H9RI54_9BACI|nr:MULTISPECIES: carbohydrate ABC transporter permease [Lysinibacillus]KEK09347.1 sugar ABC transporter permease [Lysinibacillus sphaericus]MCG7433932.1 carbohydrate ABC transporter permease [Lysinibacillus fusiformis]MCK1986597.1 carbohydrate ABC transporter permease [Lysinibacillus fusiformis]MED4078757.1 carbohydrate ABC transporter permease [Lysinibacillus fusiformis]MED4668367.1 carbohydrate ABC transporter permease [Lysinibacillus fusiformis]